MAMNSEIVPRLRDVQCITPAGLHRMAYREWGDPDNDRVLVCVHGLTRIGNDFDRVARAMLPHYRVVCPDVAGRGRSDRLRDPMLYQNPTYISDMVTLLARLDAKTVHWFGTSMGGLIGMGLAALARSEDMPAPISRMILNDVGPVISAVAVARIGGYLGRPVRFKSLDEAVSYIRQIAAPFGAHSDAEWRFLTEVVIRADGEGYVLHYDPAIAVPFKVAAAAAPDTDTSLWHIYDAITCPVLAVRGQHSDLLSAATHAEMATRGPRAELATIADVGHAPTFLHADQIAVAREFLLREN